MLRIGSYKAVAIGTGAGCVLILGGVLIVAFGGGAAPPTEALQIENPERVLGALAIHEPREIAFRVSNASRKPLRIIGMVEA